MESCSPTWVVEQCTLRLLIPLTLTYWGNIQTIFSDNGSSFIGSENELRRALEEMDKKKLQSFMQASDGDWITWKRNHIYVSHMGGVLEHQIHSVHSILSSLMQTHGRSLDEESLATLIAKTEGILNFQTLTCNTDNISDLTSSLPVSIKSFNHEIKDNFATSRRFFETWFIQPQKMEAGSTHSEWILVSLEERILAITTGKEEIDKH